MTDVVILPGGLHSGSACVRELILRPLTGSLEMLLADASLVAQPWPEFLSRLLGQAYAGTPGLDWNRGQAAALCVADRKYLLLQLVTRLLGDEFWVTAACRRCGALFELQLERSKLPVRQAGPGFPCGRIRAQDLDLDFRLPTGADQEQLSAMGETEALCALVERCLLRVDGQTATPDVIAGLSDETMALIDTAMAEMSPEVADKLATYCPECGFEQEVHFDPCNFAAAAAHGGILVDVHRLASHYHWSEAEVVALPRERRARYLQLIDLAQDWAQ